MKNILFLHSSAELYGSDRSLLNLVSGLSKRKYRIFVILPCDGPLVKELKKIQNIDVSLFPVAVLRRKNLSIKGMFSFFRDYHKTYRFLKEFIKRNNIDIVETNTSVVFAGAVAAKRAGKKSVWHIREIISNSFENRVISFMMNRYADVIVANSKATGDALMVEKKKVKIVYNAIEIKDVSKRKRSTKDIVVGMAGRINRWKGQQLFVDAAKAVHEKYATTTFLIAGDVYRGEEHLKEELERKIQSDGLNGVVKLLGRVEDMDKFYNGLDIFVLPSIKPEPFGLVVIEAMGRGIPVIATRHGGPVEIIDDGKNGFLVDYNKPEEMSEKIIELIENPEKREEIKENGIMVVKTKYTIDAMVKSMEKIYDEI